MLSELFSILPVWLVSMIAVTMVIAVYFVTLWIADTRYARQRAYLAHPSSRESKGV